jgi:hypothetical protein
MAVPDELLWLLMYMPLESMRFSIRRGLHPEKPALEAEASVLHLRGVLSSARHRRRSLGSRFGLMQLCMVTIVLLEEDCSGIATPRMARSEPRRDTLPRDNPESCLLKGRVEEELSAPTCRTMAPTCSRARPKDAPHDTERCYLLPSVDDWSPRAKVRRVLSRWSACRLLPVTMPCYDITATPRPACSEPGRNTMHRDILEPSPPKRRVKELLSAPTHRPVPWPCSRFRQRDIFHDTERWLLLLPSVDGSPRPDVRCVLSRCSGCRLLPITVPCCDAAATLRLARSKPWRDTKPSDSPESSLPK